MRKGSVIFLTGIPAAGKTTLAYALQERTGLRRLSVGDFVAEAARELHPNLTRRDLRADPDRFAPPPVVATACRRLAREANMQAQHGDVLVESHAVTPTPEGARSTPFHPDTLEILAFDGVVVLHTKIELVAARLTSGGHGRRALRETELHALQVMQDAVAVAYSVALGCPLCVLEGDGHTETLERKALVILEQLGCQVSGKDDPR